MANLGPTPDQIEMWLDELDGELRTVQGRLEPLLELQGKLQDRRVLLKSLLASFGDVVSTEISSSPNLTETTRERIHRQAIAVLHEAGKAIHSNDLHAEFNRRCYQIPGAGKPNNITVHLTGWTDIVSPGRGFYGLTEHVGEQVARGSAGRQRKRRTR